MLPPQDDASYEFAPGSKYGGSNCSMYASEEECKGKASAHGLRCEWATTSRGEAACGLGLYTHASFSTEAEIGPRGEKKKIGLRHICGDTLADCATFSHKMNHILDMINQVPLSPEHEIEKTHESGDDA